MTISGTVKTVVPVGSAFLAQQVIEPLPLDFFQKATVTTVSGFVAYYIIKYLVSQNEKKDERIAAMHSEQLAQNAAHITMLVDELRESRSSRLALNDNMAAQARSNETLSRELRELAAKIRGPA